MSPSTRPSTKGATGKPRRRSQKQATPTPSITHTSNRRWVIEYEPSTHSTKTMGMMISRGTFSTHRMGRTRISPKTRIASVATSVMPTTS